ncbi:Na+/H+ antiporter NhaA [Rhizobiaceae bacterium BDR2-2]|uniref:Na(+)/H(+) antiporter NhaA n=1 Tax=Ectorhizobium quercum TaxID=2965071 RepID=A0AAE3N154_9HYPH|nr:Na+/H+ antiporter NhaA [Ectorhizobium quercum]MCX8998241.1 Na+/H+ antiporter NhaA [Ectorhizobium quercum]
MHRIWNYLQEYSLLLVFGAITALVWANTAPGSYHAIVDYPLWEGGFVGHLHDGHRTLTLHYLINDMLMAFFFAIAGKEVWEAVALKNGSLRGKKAVTPLIATAGGMLGPVAVYLGGAFVIGKFGLLASGWAIPTATDIAFSYLVGRLVFGAGHPAVMFLLLLAIADDAGGLIILAIFYPQGDLAPQWLLLSFGAALAVWFLANRLPRLLDGNNPRRPVSSAVKRRLSFWPYLIAAAASWYGFQEAGIHPALGLLPIIPAIPHAETDFGFFAEEERYQTDLLNRIEHALKAPVQIVLLLFGLANAGVEFSAMDDVTWLVLGGLIVGKPLGITLMGWIAARPLGFGLPEGMRLADLPVIGCVAAIGFTVALFVAGVAFPPGAEQDAAKMGALFSFGAAAIAIVAGRIFAVRRKHVVQSPAHLPSSG